MTGLLVLAVDVVLWVLSVGGILALLAGADSRGGRDYSKKEKLRGGQS